MGIYALEAVGLVAGGQFAAAEGDDGEAFGGSHVGSLPPVAADGATGNVGHAVPFDALVDVGVALKDAENIVALEETDDFG